MPESCSGNGLVLTFLALFLGVLALAAGLLALRNRRALENTPLSRIRSLAMGRAKVEGHTAGPTLLAPLTGTPCVYYRYAITTRDTDSDRVVDSGDSGGLPVRLAGRTGEIWLDMRDVELHLGAEHRTTVDSPPLGGPLADFARARGIELPRSFHVEETRIPSGVPLVAHGVARPAGGIEARLAQLYEARQTLDRLAARPPQAAEAAPDARLVRRHAARRMRQLKAAERSQGKGPLTEARLVGLRDRAHAEAEEMARRCAREAERAPARLAAARSAPHAGVLAQAGPDTACVASRMLAPRDDAAPGLPVALGPQPSRRRPLAIYEGGDGDGAASEHADTVIAAFLGVVLVGGAILALAALYPECGEAMLGIGAMLVVMASVIGGASLLLRRLLPERFAPPSR